MTWHTMVGSVITRAYLQHGGMLLIWVGPLPRWPEWWREQEFSQRKSQIRNHHHFHTKSNSFYFLLPLCPNLKLGFGSHSNKIKMVEQIVWCSEREKEIWTDLHCHLKILPWNVAAFEFDSAHLGPTFLAWILTSW